MITTQRRPFSGNLTNAICTFVGANCLLIKGLERGFDDFLSFKRINCDEFQFFLAFFMLLRNNPPPLYVPSGLMRYKTYPYLNGIRQSQDWLEMVEHMGPWLFIILVGSPCLIL